MDQYNREPCPWRIVSDCGGAFTMGCVGGALFGFVGGARNAPAGFNRRAIGGLVRMRERGPILGGQFAAWCLCFSSFECSLVSLRQVDPRMQAPQDPSLLGPDPSGNRSFQI